MQHACPDMVCWKPNKYLAYLSYYNTLVGNKNRMSPDVLSVSLETTETESSGSGFVFLYFLGIYYDTTLA